MSSILGESGYARKALDSYFTIDGWVTRWALGSGLLPAPSPGLVVWEPACAVGHISREFTAVGYDVLSTDVVDHGWEGMAGIQDFFGVSHVDPCIGLIVTNPPFEVKDVPGVTNCTAETFIRHALKLMQPVNGSVLILLRHEYECAVGRRDLFDRPPFRAKMTLTKRPNWVDSGMNKMNKPVSPRFNYAWFFFDWKYKGDAQLLILPKIH